ncbi:MAG: von Willebrand factor type A domain-containing protein [Acidobacteriota bacterium]
MTLRDDLARKLSEGGVPEPPEELLHRIKKDIPSELPLVKLEGELLPIRLYRTGWAVAASVLVLVAMSFVMLRTLQFSGFETQPAAVADKALPREGIKSESAARGNAVPPQSADGPTASSSAAKKIDQEGTQLEAGRLQSLQVAAAAPPKKNENDNLSGFAPEVVGGAKGKEEKQQLRDATEAARSRESHGNEPLVAQSRPAAEFQTEPDAESKDERAERNAVGVPASAASGMIAGGRRDTAQKPAATPAPVSAPSFSEESIAKSRKAVVKEDAAASTVSSFSFDGTSGSYELIRSALIGRNELPSPQVVRVGEVVNHFEYGDESARRSELVVHAEGTPDPLLKRPDTIVIRIAIRGRSQLPAGASVRVEFNPDAVTRFRLIGYNQTSRDGEGAPEIGTGPSVTALYEVQLRNASLRSADLAKIRVRYASAGDSRQTNEAERSIAMSDIAQNWQSASPRLKLAVLVADWAEVLRRSSYGLAIDPEQLAARAEQLSSDFDGEAGVNDFLVLVKRTVALLRASR